MKLPLNMLLASLPRRVVLLQCLDENRDPILDASASGFLRREDDKIFLYTCWHVVTGFDMHNVKIGVNRANRSFLQVSFQEARVLRPGSVAIGGVIHIVVPLYDDSYSPPRPVWFQDIEHVPHEDLNRGGLHLPVWHDLVKIELPADVPISDYQLVNECKISTSTPTPGDKCLIAGYPYGYSSWGEIQPTGVVLTRFLASSPVINRPQQMLLESAGMAGMSGGPAYIERDGDLEFFGIYAGIIYPDYMRNTNNPVTTLGVVNDITFTFNGFIPLVRSPEITIENHKNSVPFRFS